MIEPFRFKQFSVAHDQCAMKVGVDGVLLGAVATSEKPNHILDIGTGSGLIALMASQRFPAANIQAIEPNKVAYKQAEENFKNAPFTKKVEVFNTSLANFETEKKYDLIICNPPFYKESMTSGDLNRDQARMAGHLPLSELLKSIKSMLSEVGMFYFIYPASDHIIIQEEILKHQLTIGFQLNIFPTKDKPCKRIIYGVSLKKTKQVAENLVIENSRHRYTDSYITTVKDFYLNF